MEKITGISRKVDELGRVVIPKELRKNLGIEEGDLIEISLKGHDVILRKASQKCCTACGQVVDLKDKFCRNCGKEQ
nr:MAG TPA: stage V sporulation protein T [Caudoviricetes sp.]